MPFFNGDTCFTCSPQQHCLAVLCRDVLEETSHVGDILVPLLLLGTNPAWLFRAPGSSGVNAPRQISAPLVAWPLTGGFINCGLAIL